MSAALMVEGGDKEEEEGGPPQDGMAYLRQVMRERKRVPETVTAEIKPKKQKPDMAGGQKSAGSGGGDLGDLNSRTKVPPPPGCCPGPGWQREQVARFSEVRQRVGRHAELGRRTGEVMMMMIMIIMMMIMTMQVGVGTVKVPDKRNEALWCHLVLGGRAWAEVCGAREDEEGGSKAKTEVAGDEPSLNFLLSVPVHVCEAVLEHLVAWLTLTGWRSEAGPWLYSLLVRLEKPLTPDISSVLRDLVLFCSRERRKIAALNVDKTAEDRDENIAALNLFICLVAKYFGQGDLEDVDDE